MTTCYFCGEAGADTEEEIPPRAFFPDGQRQGIIKIPAHGECNRSWSDSIEYFRNLFAGLGAKNNFTASVLFDTKGRRSLRRSPKLNMKMISDLGRRFVYKTESGIYLGSQPAIHIDPKHWQDFVEHMVRGLYFHHKGVPLPQDVEVKPHFGVRGDAPEFIKRAPIIEIHPKVFKYRYCFANDHDYSSGWVLSFYDTEAVTIFAITDPVDGRESLPTSKTSGVN